MLGLAKGVSPAGGQLGLLHLEGTVCQERLGNRLSNLSREEIGGEGVRSPNNIPHRGYSIFLLRKNLLGEFDSWRSSDLMGLWRCEKGPWL